MTSVSRGSLRIYLGAAPGVGKTFRMLGEGVRRRTRGTDVVIAFVETHGRDHTIAQIADLPRVPRLQVEYRGAQFEEMDLAAVLRRRPQLALVDEMAHTNIPGSGPNPKRWQDIETLLDAGIDVITTVNIQHLESLNDVVREITGVAQRETVPDAPVRAAEQIELVDMTPQALRRRMAHGNIYGADKIDAALGNYFRPGNLTALRELALLWLADSVEDGMQRYREQHGITAVWETRERVVVGLTGGSEGDTLIRRAARIAARSSGGDLMAVHVARGDGLADADSAALTGQRLLVESLGGTYHSVLGDNTANALLEFARSVDATQIVLGVSRRPTWSALLTGPGTSGTVSRLSGNIDVHMVSHDLAGKGRTLPSFTGGVTLRRRILGIVVAIALLGVVTATCSALRSQLSFASDVSLYLLVVIVASLIGGFYPAIVAACVGSVLLNFYFAPPLHRLTIAHVDNVVALIIFLLVAILVSRVVDLAARRSVKAARAATESDLLSTFAGSLLRGEQQLPALLERVRESFGMHSVSLLSRLAASTSLPHNDWSVLATVGEDAPTDPIQADAIATIDDHLCLALRGRSLPAQDQRVLSAFAAHIAVAYRQRQLSEAAAAAEPIAEAERQRTTLLNAVSHDLRTPIATAKAAVSSLRAPDLQWSEGDTNELLATADTALDQLTELVTNLLDLSRLQAGALSVLRAPVSAADIVARALDFAITDRLVDIDIPDDLPEIYADAGLLERVVANLVQNAVRYAPADTRVRVAGSVHDGTVEIRVIDHGPGIPVTAAEQVFAAFQRRDDHSADGTGVGLGLAIARGFAEAMGGSVHAEETPGGGATLVVSLQVWTGEPR
jgi:two-component system sensor histidine kinase KdpD